jgi:hypothetical protein
MAILMVVRQDTRQILYVRCAACRASIRADFDLQFQTMTQMKTCNVSTVEGAMEAAIFLRDLQLDS